MALGDGSRLAPPTRLHWEWPFGHQHTTYWTFSQNVSLIKKNKIDTAFLCNCEMNADTVRCQVETWGRWAPLPPQRSPGTTSLPPEQPCSGIHMKAQPDGREQLEKAPQGENLGQTPTQGRPGQRSGVGRLLICAARGPQRAPKLPHSPKVR